MAVSYYVSPASGDSSAAVYTNTSMSKKCGELASGTPLNVYTQSGNMYKIKYSSGGSSRGFPKDGKVKVNSTLNIRSAPSSSGVVWGTLKNGTSVEIDDQSGDWWHIRVPRNGYVSKSYITLTDGDGESAYISATDVKSSGSSSTVAETSSSPEVALAYFNNYTYTTDGASNDEFYKEFIERIQFTLGTPPKYNMDIDIQFISDIGIGRVQQDTIYSNPTLLSICPGKVKMFPDLFGQKKDTAFNSMLSLASGNSSLTSKLNGDTSSLFSGKLYEFSSDTAGFAKRLNVLCRAAAVLMGIGKMNMPKTTALLENFDYAYWTIRKAYTPAAGKGADKDTSIFKSFLNAGLDAMESGVNDKNYIHFMVTNGGTSISENMATNVGESILASALQTVNSATASLSYFLGSGFSDLADISSQIDKAAANNTTIGDWTNMADNLLKGAQMTLPKQISGVDWSQSVSCDLTFVSPYGDPLSIFLWCVVPIMHILALALPKQVSDNMYTFPHICRVCQKGWFNSNLAVVSGVQIRRGGNEDTSWTNQDLATEWNVTFEVVPLLEQLMVTSSDNPFLFIKNDSLVDYLGNLCGFDLKANNFSTKTQLFKSFVENRFTGIPNDVQRYISDGLADMVSKITQF